jgi:hypothetical protein
MYNFDSHWFFRDPYIDLSLFVKSCIALYDFDGKVTNSLEMKAGEAFLLIEKSDKKGDTQWYLVENENGQRGYVPSSYVLVLNWTLFIRGFY